MLVFAMFFITTERKFDLPKFTTSSIEKSISQTYQLNKILIYTYKISSHCRRF